jgi:2-polyprenyl-3-methyl-5-hydroxy-6-metoxy-1,4-benzoquinol methylase
MPTVEELAQCYGNYFNYEWYTQHLPLKKVQARHRWRRMGPLFIKYGIKKGNFLDIGCGHGLFVDAAFHSGWNAMGLDYPSAATDHARNRLRMNIVEADLAAAVESEKLREAQFDFITAWHCLEHYSKPMGFLSYATKLLKPGGKLLLAVPNAEAKGMKRRRDDWVWCQEPFVHVVHYNAQNLSRAARSAGLNVVSVWSRDTWDASHPYDNVVEPTVRRISRRARRINSKLAFGFEEGTRLVFYFSSCMDHWLLGHECKNGDGSELLLLAERPLAI